VLMRFILLDLVLTAGSIALLVYIFRSGNAQPLTASPLFWVAIAILVISGITFAWGMVQRNSTEMVVTTKHVMIKTGLVTRNTNEMMLSKIESVRVEQGVLGRMLDFGTIVLHGTGGTPDPFPRIAHPLEFRRQVQQQIDKLPAEERRLSGT